jgi:hypothetical protein
MDLLFFLLLPHKHGGLRHSILLGPLIGTKYRNILLESLWFVGVVSSLTLVINL